MNQDEDLDMVRIKVLYQKLEQEFKDGKNLNFEQRIDIKRQKRLHHLTTDFCNAIEAKMRQYYPFW
ncbi:hypothetical protein AB0756_39425 [Tolypothrix campylonemoides VB511288_2]|uniref:Uncharacterized protein n=3 Tax=Nostocales TaxID=1161 RepID=A0A0C1NFR4_9CYAN